MHRGYTKRWRKRWDKGYHYDALLWLLMDYFIDFANWKDNEMPFLWKGKLVEMINIQRGQCFFTIQALSDFLTGPKNKVSRDMIRSRLEILEKIGFLSREQSQQYQIVTILNYDLYNPIEEQEPREQSQQTHANATPNPHQTHTPNKVNKDNKEKKVKNKDIYSAKFSEFWAAYPRKIGKDAAWSAWKRRNGDRPDNDIILTAIKNQQQGRQWQEGYIPLPTTWINQGRWNDEPEDPIQRKFTAKTARNIEVLKQWGNDEK